MRFQNGAFQDGNVLELDQRDFLGIIESLRMTASSRINSHTGINRIDETSGNITVEESDLLVNEKIIDRQTYAHHRRSDTEFLNFVSGFHKLLFQAAIRTRLLQFFTEGRLGLIL